MKVKPSIKQYFYCCVYLLCLFVCSSEAYGQTSTWNGSSWSTVAPSASTGSYTFYVDGPGCVIGDANMTSLYVRYDFTDCNITGTITATNVVVEYDTDPFNRALLNIDGTLNVVNLTIVGKLTGAGTINLSAGSFSQSDGIHFGILNPLTTLNLLTGSVTFPMYFSVVNLTISTGASAIISNYNYNYGPSITNLTVNGSLTNNYAYNDIMVGPIYLTVSNLDITSTGSYNSSSGYTLINQSFKIGGSISHAGSSNSYKYDFSNPSSNKILEVYSNANISFTDISNSNINNKYIGTLRVYNGGRFKVDKNLTVGTVTISSGGSITASGSPTVTISSIDPIDGRLILQTATLNYTPTTLTLNGTNSAIGYINKPSMKVTVTGSTDTIRNCTLQQVTVNSGAKGYISNSAAGYKIQRLDVNDSVTIVSMPKCDSLNVSGTGKVKIKGDTRLNRLVDIASGGSITSKGNLTMRDSSNLFFVSDGQIDSIKWHRKYGSTGWILFGVPFRHLNRGLISTTGGIAQQTIGMNKFVESRSSPRWVAVGANDTLGVGVGYDLAMATILNDTLIFRGQPSLQPVTVSGLLYTPTNGNFDYQRGYNLVANPYTAPINISGFFGDNPGLNKIYLYDNIFQNHGLYVTCTSSGILTPDTTAVTVKNRKKISASYIAPNMGFFIKLDSSNYTTITSVKFKPTSITRNSNNNFLKSTPVYLRLYAKNTSGTRNDIVFQFNDAATQDINPSFDFSKMVSDSYPLEIYSIKRGSRFSIQTVKIDTALRIPIGLIVKNSEKHSLWINSFEALPSATNVYIYDKTAKRSVNLKDSVFTVSLTAGTYDNRFEIVFKNNSTTDINTSVASRENKTSEYDVKVRTISGQVFVDFDQEQKNVNIMVSDISGRVLYEKSLAWVQGTVPLGQNFYSNRVYIIRISGNNIFKICKLAL